MGVLMARDDYQSGEMEDNQQARGDAKRGDTKGRKPRQPMSIASHDSLAPSLTGSKTRRFS
jgi:hypothetical protein